MSHVAPVFQDLEGEPNDVVTRRRVSSLRALFKAAGGMDIVIGNLNFLGLPDLDLSRFDRAFREVCRVGRWDIPPRFSLSPISSPAVCMHWRAQVELMDLLGREEMEAFIHPTSSPKVSSGSDQPLQGGSQGVSQGSPFTPVASGGLRGSTYPSPPVLVSSGATRGSPSPPSLLSLPAQNPSPSSAGSPAPKPVSIFDVKFSKSATQRLALRFPMDLPEAFDAHCHYDRSLRSMGLEKTATLSDFIRIPLEAPPRNPVKLAGGVVVFCDPPTWPKPGHIPQEQGWRISVGIHPKKPKQFGDARFDQLDQLMACPEVSALGEIGLDWSIPRNQWGLQESTFAWALKAQKAGKPIVLHLRGEDGDPLAGEVHSRALQIVQERCRPQDTKIHLHCFTGGREQVRCWRAAFPETYFGFTQVVSGFTGEQKAALASLPADRVLLESDAPYFPFPPAKFGHPHYLWEVAALVGEIRRVCANSILADSRRNGVALYG